MINTAAERRTFSIDSEIIFQHIFGSQRTDTCGAFCELIQNSFDSNSTVVHLTLFEDGFSVIDNGDGFKDKESIYQWFEVFGAEKNKENNRVFSQFRMGRGQIMGICSTTWQTHNYMMHVDIKNKGLDYDLYDSDSCFDGCKITGEWYEPITSHYYSYETEKTTEGAIKYLVAKISERCKYIFGMEIYINGIKINKGANEYKWDVDTEDHYFLKASTLTLSYKPGEVNIYNLGMHVQTLSDMPSAGALISKTKLRINVTRNSVQPDCPVYKNMLRSLATCKPKLHPNVKYSINRSADVLLGFLEGIYELEEIAHLKLFSDIHCSRHKSLVELSQIEFTISDSKDSMGADRVDQTGRVFVIDSGIVSYRYRHMDVKNEGKSAEYVCGTFAQELFFKVREYSEELFSALFYSFRTFGDCVEDVSGDNIILSPSELSKPEKRFLEVLVRVKKQYRGNIIGMRNREFVLGSSVRADAWTDGEKFICLHRTLLRKLNSGLYGALEIASIIIHECCHVADETEIHDHNFYRHFHDLIINRNANIYIAELLLVALDDVLFENNIKGTPSFVKAAGLFRKNGIARCARPEAISAS